jgi:hypothetical protein
MIQQKFEKQLGLLQKLRQMVFYMDQFCHFFGASPKPGFFASTVVFLRIHSTYAGKIVHWGVYMLIALKCDMKGRGRSVT